MRENVNPAMDLMKQSTPQPGSKSGVNTGGAIPVSKRPIVNPDMELVKGSAVASAIQDEKSPAVMPNVGNMPTGEKSAKKHMPL